MEQRVVACLSSFYGAAWLAALWAPLAAAGASGRPIFRYFTWWCWLLQAAFYTAVHPWVRRRAARGACGGAPPRAAARALGVVCGNVAFTCIQFIAVLARHPTLVAEAGARLRRPAAAQLASAGLHYLTVSALLLWTLFDIDHVRRVLSEGAARHRARFCAEWTALPLLYATSYAWDLRAVARAYGVPLDAWTVASTLLAAALAGQFNLLYLAHLCAYATPLSDPAARACAGLSSGSAAAV